MIQDESVGYKGAMSDIAIRFDGLFLLMALALSACVYLLIALIGLAAGFVRSCARAWKVAGRAGCMGLVTAVAAVGFAVYWDKHSLDYRGINWVDQLTYPWAAVFLGGCWYLARVR